MVNKIIKKPKSWRVNHKSPEVFCMSQWQRRTKSTFYLIYRILFALAFITITIYSFIDSIVIEKDFAYWFIYLTNNGLTICTIMACYGAVLVTLYHFDYVKLETNAITYKIFWILSNMAVVMAFVISIVYWSLLFKWELYFKGEFPLTVPNLLKHGINSVLMLIDLLVTLHPIHFLHVIHSYIVGLLYTIFTIIYFYAGGTDNWGNRYVYNIINWENAGKTSLYVLLVFALTTLVHGVVCMIQIARSKIHNYLTKTERSFDITNA